FVQIHPHVLPDGRRMQAVFQRAIVRAYNGGTEVRGNGTDLVINPSKRDWEDKSDHTKGANTAPLYPNRVLSTAVTYFVGNGTANRVIEGPTADAQTRFPRPIAFGVGDFGPGI